MNPSKLESRQQIIQKTHIQTHEQKRQALQRQNDYYFSYHRYLFVGKNLKLYTKVEVLIPLN